MSLHGLRNYGFSSWHLVSSWLPLLWYVPMWYCVAVAVVRPTLYKINAERTVALTRFVAR